PGKVPAASIARDLSCTMDLFTTFLTIAGAEVPKDRPIDGLDISPVLFGTGPGPRKVFVYYRDTSLYALRKGNWKAHVVTRSAYGKDAPEKHDPPLLFDLARDPSEQFDVAAKHPDIVADLLKEIAAHEAGMKPGENQLEQVLQQE